MALRKVDLLRHWRQLVKQCRAEGDLDGHALYGTKLVHKRTSKLCTDSMAGSSHNYAFMTVDFGHDIVRRALGQ